MKFRKLILFILLSTCVYAQEESSPTIFEQIAWQHGPSNSRIDDIAELRIPGGYIFANGDDTRLLMESMGNPLSNSEVGFFSPETIDWFVVFEFNAVGYIEDDEKNSFDNDAMLESIREGTEKSNKYRKERGFTTLHVIGWETLPHYDETTHNLEWAVKFKDENGDLIINHNTRILGRRGVMVVTLVVDPTQLAEVVPIFKLHMKDFSFQTGQKYTEFVQGDKIAEYGLTALIVGGAAAVAVKSGLLKYIWKILVFVVVGIGAFFKKLFNRKTKE